MLNPNPWHFKLISIGQEDEERYITEKLDKQVDKDWTGRGGGPLSVRKLDSGGHDQPESNPALKELILIMVVDP